MAPMPEIKVRIWDVLVGGILDGRGWFNNGSINEREKVVALQHRRNLGFPEKIVGGGEFDSNHVNGSGERDGIG